MKSLVTAIAIVGFTFLASSQITAPKFGSGIQIVAQDSSFTMKIGWRFQNLFINEWTVRDDDFNYVEGHSSNFLVRRARLKFDGSIFSTVKYKMELGLSNRDISGGNSAEHSFASRFILDAYLDWNFYRGFTLRVGQGKLPGNRERVISSGNLQFVDRSRLNSAFNIDRDMGLQLHHSHSFGDFKIKEIACLTQGEGRDITAGASGGYDYTFRLEFLPFGDFAKKGDYVGSSIIREEKPKLAVGFTYDINQNAVRQRGQLGSFIYDLSGQRTGKTLNTVFIDLMFKYKGLSVMAEYANKTTADGDANVYDNGVVVGAHTTGQGLNFQAGWMFQSNWEIAGRYTKVDYSSSNSYDNEYTLGLSKFIVGHKLKVQTDVTYRQRGDVGDTTPNGGRNDGLTWRMQMDLHF